MDQPDVLKVPKHAKNKFCKLAQAGKYKIASSTNIRKTVDRFCDADMC